MSGSCEPVFEDVESFCWVSRRVVELSLRCSVKAKGDVVSGVPDSCSLEHVCSGGAKCLLRAERVTTSRRKAK